MSTKSINVTLGERESDVLRGLVETVDPIAEREIIDGVIREGVRPDDARHGVPAALRLLHNLGFVRTLGNEQELHWVATAEGIAAVKKPWVS